MKKNILLLIFALTGLFTNAQVNVINSTNGSLTITPKGIRGKLPTNNTNDVTNIVLGDGALSSNIIGESNVAIGHNALSTNVAKSAITAIGYNAMKYATNNTTSKETFNTAMGFEALRGSLNAGGNVGMQNTAIGALTMSNNTSGTDNVAVGYSALYNNFSGVSNVAVGASALNENTIGRDNVAVGYTAGDNITAGSQNTFLGVGSDASANNLSNSIAIGYSVIVNASNKAVIGSSSVTTIGGYGNWSNYSDRRLKENIRYTDRLGLDFILKLKTASYNYTSDSNKRRRDGMIAQDVQSVMQELGVPFSGLVEDDDAQKTLNLAYADFVMPLINAVKEQQVQIEKLKQENLAYKDDIQMLKSSIAEIKTSLKIEFDSKKIGDK